MKNAEGNGFANGNGGATKSRGQEWEAGTDYTRWRMKDDRGTQTWHYLESDEEVEKWPQSTADKWYLGMDTVSAPPLYMSWQLCGCKAIYADTFPYAENARPPAREDTPPSYT